MSFTSLSYIMFLPAVFLLSYFAGNRARWQILLVASIIFYATLQVPYLLLALLLVAASSFFFGIRIDDEKSDARRKRLLWCAVGITLLPLICLKYLAFFMSNVLAVAGYLGIHTSIHASPVLVSIGVSFYVFQAISYLVDIYLEVEKPERHFGIFLLFLGFFPKMLQGPIERAGDLLPQLRQPHSIDYSNIRSGLFLFIFGLFKKVVVADRLGLLVNNVYDNMHDFSGPALLLATYLYAIQLYYDFSGYTDMALGSARIFNINLTQNFNSPYLATSIADFWRRWHISFSRWILDYIFKPLQMQLRNWRSMGTAVALFLTFLVSGIWHGAGWGFIAWGLIHGTYLASSVLFKPMQKKIHRALHLEKTLLLKTWQRFVTFHLVCFSWIFFRANNFSDALYAVSNIPAGLLNFFRSLLADIGSVPKVNSLLRDTLKPVLGTQSRDDIYVAVLGLLIVTGINHLVKKRGETELLTGTSWWFRWPMYYTLTFGVLFFGTFNSTQQFIYYQF